MLYICLNFLAILLQGNRLISLIREGYIITLFFLLIATNLKHLFINKTISLILLYIIINLISLFISSNKNEAVMSFFLFSSGPVIFLLLYNFNFDNQLYSNIKKKIFKLFFFFVISGLIIYPFQLQFCNLINHDPTMLYRWGKNGKLWLRLGGLSLHPTIMGAVCIFLLLYLWFYRRKKETIISLIAYYYTNTRTVLFGLPFAFFYYQSFKRKIFFSLLAIPIVMCGVIFFLNYNFDPSAIIHFIDVFIEGPKMILNNFSLLGIGHGMMSPYTSRSAFIHLESDLYIMMMQIGIIGFLVYFCLICRIIHILRKDGNEYSKYCLYLVFIFNIGSIFFPFHTIRFLSNYVWIELGFYFSYRRSLCR